MKLILKLRLPLTHFLKAFLDFSMIKAETISEGSYRLLLIQLIQRGCQAGDVETIVVGSRKHQRWILSA